MAYYVQTPTDNGYEWHSFNSIEKARAYAIKDMVPVVGFTQKVFNKKSTIRSAAGIISLAVDGYRWIPLDDGYYREPQPAYHLYKNGKLGKFIRWYK